MRVKRSGGGGGVGELVMKEGGGMRDDKPGNMDDR